MDITAGTIVIPKAGRGKGQPFIAINVEDGYAWITDGKTRKLDNPKKKKLMHLQPVKTTGEAKIEIRGNKLQDSDIRAAIAAYIGNGHDRTENKI